MAMPGNPVPGFDAVVVGGGPGGSTAAAALARAGLRVGLLESDPFPRFHIGESLLSEANTVLRAIGAHERVLAAGFVRKRGARFLDETGARDVVFDFGDNPKIPEPLTFQVPRARFDHVLLEHAVDSGATLLPWRAKTAQFDDDGVTLTCAEGGERTHELRTPALLDASGRAGFLARQLDLRVDDAELRKLAVYAHFRGVPRDDGIRGGDIRIVSGTDLSWAWLIPLPDDVMSIGFVIDLAGWHGKKPTPEQLLEERLGRWPLVRRLVANATRISPVHLESSFSYGTRRYAGRRFLLVGDAGSFLDPVFSSGVMFALDAGLEAARCLLQAMQQGRLRQERFGAFDRRQRRRYRLVRRFVTGFYRSNFRDFFFSPTPHFGLVHAITSVLAGRWNPGPVDRLRLATLFGLAQLQRVVTVVPRLHNAAPSAN